MRRLAFLACLLLLLPITAQADPGPDPPRYHRDFEIFFRDIPTHEVLYRVPFAVSQGWDFGDRAGYSCAWAEHYTSGALDFVAAFDRVGDYSALEVNDRYGHESQNVCAPGGQDGHAPFDGVDHHPHGTTITVYRDGLEIAALDLEQGRCDKGYWSPGDEPGEAWLWWDADGPTETMPGLADCSGGPGEPVPVLRAMVTVPGPGITVCTADRMDGDMCS